MARLNTGIKEIPPRAKDWFKALVDDENSDVYDRFPTVVDKLSIPNPLNLQEDDNPYPAVSITQNGWQQIEENENRQDGEMGFQLELLFMVYLLNNLQTNPVKDISILQADCLSLFIQQPQGYPPRDPDNPTDTSKWLWRPEDSESTGLSLYRLTAREAPPVAPLRYEGGIIVERAPINITVQGIARPV